MWKERIWYWDYLNFRYLLDLRFGNINYRKKSVNLKVLYFVDVLRKS